jgi:hypothetical protein
LFGSAKVKDSHPFRGLPSQFAKPGFHLRPQTPAEQVGMAFGPAGQTAPQWPQLRMSVLVSTSHPFNGLLSQFANPVLHCTPQILLEQVGDPLETPGQSLPQPPQLNGVPKAVSHPFRGFRHSSQNLGCIRCCNFQRSRMACHSLRNILCHTHHS